MQLFAKSMLSYCYLNTKREDCQYFAPADKKGKIMSLPQNYKEEYLAAMLHCLDGIRIEREYSAKKREYKALLAEINSSLATSDAIVTDAERLIDKNKRCVRKEAQSLGIDLITMLSVERLAALYAECATIADSLGVEDEIGIAMEMILRIAAYEDWEKRIYADLGRIEAEKVIISVKRKAVREEEAAEISFFGEGLEMLESLQRIRTLCPVGGAVQLSGVTENLDTRLTVLDAHGKRMTFRLIASVVFAGDTYLELVCPDSMKIRRPLNYYRVSSTPDGVTLTLVEDEHRHATLSSITDNLL